MSRGSICNSLHDIVIEYTDSAHGDGAHRQFFLAGHAQLADEKNIQRGAQSLGHFVTDRHASAGKRENDYIRSTLVRCKFFGKLLTGLSPVSEWEVFHGWIRRR